MLSSSSSSSSSSTSWSRRRELFFGSAIFGPLLQGFASTTQAVPYPIQPFREFFGSIISAIEIFAKWQSAGILSFLPGKDFVCVHDQATSLEFFDGIPFFSLCLKSNYIILSLSLLLPPHFNGFQVFRKQNDCFRCPFSSLFLFFHVSVLPLLPNRWPVAQGRKIKMPPRHLHFPFFFFFP